MEESSEAGQSAVKPSSVSSEVEFLVKLKDESFTANVQVHIDSEDNVTLAIPDHFKVSDDNLTSVTLRTAAKVKILPDLLSTRFGPDNKLFYSTCSVFVNLEFNRTSEGILKCCHCDYIVDILEASSRDEMAEMLLQHLPQHQDYLPCLRFSCKKCPPPAVVVPIDQLIKHFERNHPDALVSNGKDLDGSKDGDNTEYICPICSMVTFNNAALMRHMKDYHSADSKNTPQMLPSLDDIENGIEVMEKLAIGIYTHILAQCSCH